MTIPLLQYLQYLKYFAVALSMLIAFALLYMRITPVAELKLIKRGILPVLFSLSGSMIGFASL